MSEARCPRCWGLMDNPGGVCNRCYSWYQDWLYRRLPEQKASLAEWRLQHPADPRPEVRGHLNVKPGSEKVPPLTSLFHFGGRSDPCYFTDPGPGWDNAVRAYEEDR